MSDAELDRLKAAMDLAWQHKQDASNALDRARQRRSETREPMLRAQRAKQEADAVQQESWSELSSLRDRHGPRIEWLNQAQKSAYQNMLSAFQRASQSHEARDGMARQYADEGHTYKAESQGYVAERRELVSELRATQAVHEDNQVAFRRAKQKYDELRRPFDRAKAEHERLKEELRDRKSELYKARDAFMRRLREVRGARIRRNEENRSLAERAGVPSMYLDDLWVSWNGDTVNIYFGGIGAPNGEGHGHYAMHISGKVTYRRDPFTPHGSHNFTDQRKPRTGRQREEKPFDPFEGTIFAMNPPQSTEPEFDDVLGPFMEEVSTSRWTPAGSQPPDVGVIEGTDHVVSFKTSGDETLIADGDFSNDNKGFKRDVNGDKSHDHYGPWGGTDRGRYTGPGS